MPGHGELARICFVEWMGGESVRLSTVLFCFVLFCFVLFCFVLSCLVLSCLVVSLVMLPGLFFNSFCQEEEERESFRCCCFFCFWWGARQSFATILDFGFMCVQFADWHKRSLATIDIHIYIYVERERERECVCVCVYAFRLGWCSFWRAGPHGATMAGERTASFYEHTPSSLSARPSL